jgi:hypothetical protein
LRKEEAELRLRQQRERELADSTAMVPATLLEPLQPVEQTALRAVVEAQRMETAGNGAKGVVAAAAVAPVVPLAAATKPAPDKKTKLKAVHSVFARKACGTSLGILEVLNELGTVDYTASEVQKVVVDSPSRSTLHLTWPFSRQIMNQLVTLKLLQKDGEKWAMKVAK